MKVESEKMKWPLIMDRSSQKTKQRFVSTWPQIWSKSVEISIDCLDASAPLITPSPLRSPQTRLILLFPVIVLVISGIFGRVFALESRDFAGFNIQNNVLNNEIKNECESEKSGLSNNEYHETHTRTHTHTAHTAAPAIDTHDKICPTGVGLRDFDIIGCIFNGNIDNDGLQYDISFGM